MKNTAIKTALATLVVSSIVVSCKKKDVSPEPTPVAVDHSLDSVNMLASGKGFKKVYGYIEPSTAYYPGTLNEIHALALSVERTDKVNFAFSQSSGSQQGSNISVLRGTANYATQNVITAPVGFTYTKPSGSSWQELGFMYAPYSNKLAFMYYDYSGPGYVSGDVTESSGQSLLTNDRRIAKTGHSVYSIVGSQGAGSATQTNGFTYGYYDASNTFKQLSSSDGTFTGIQFPLRASSLYKGIFEPILATNEGIVILYSKDSINVYLNNLTTPAVKFTLITKIALTTPMELAGYSIIKNNANDNDFSFACVEGTKVWSFKYNNLAKTVTKVLDGATLPATITSPDIDENGNLYYISTNSIYKVSATGNTTVAQDVLTNGTLSVLKYYSGKLFLLAERFKNTDGTQGRRQLDVLMQE